MRTLFGQLYLTKPFSCFQRKLETGGNPFCMFLRIVVLSQEETQKHYFPGGGENTANLDPNFAHCCSYI